MFVGSQLAACNTNCHKLAQWQTVRPLVSMPIRLFIPREPNRHRKVAVRHEKAQRGFSHGRSAAACSTHPGTSESSWLGFPCAAIIKQRRTHLLELSGVAPRSRSRRVISALPAVIVTCERHSCRSASVETPNILRVCAVLETLPAERVRVY